MNNVDLYTIKKDVICLECGGVGAIQSYGKYYPNGLEGKYKDIKVLEKYQDKPYMSRSVGFGGTIPYECINCGNQGLIDFGGLEGYQQAFKSVGDKQ